MDTDRFNKSKSLIPTPIKQKRVADRSGSKRKLDLEFSASKRKKPSDGRKSIKRKSKRKIIS